MKFYTVFFIFWVSNVYAITPSDPIKTPYIAPNVSFSSVMALPFEAADAKISYGENPLQHGLFWRAKSQLNKPIVVLIHGGCWLNAFGVDHAQAMATALTAKGHNVWALEYRRTGDEGGGWPGSFEDVLSGIAAIDQLPTDIYREEIILIGHSAGGHLALLAQQKSNKTTRPLITKTIGLAAITNLTAYAAGQNSCQAAGPKFMGGSEIERPTAYHNADPKQQGTYNNTVLLQGQADVIVPEDQAKLSGAKTIKLATAGHFDWIHPQTEAFDLLLKTIELD